MDCLLGSIVDVDIKHSIRHGGSWQLLKQHSNLMSDRAAQLSALCQDLIQAIVGYRAERKQTQDISETELDGLADLGLKLATVMATVSATQALSVKRVAPFLLIFTIRQMVTTERPTTLFKIQGSQHSEE
ncbi:GM16247 [Drosophila sechellia]|uniref:GM16247 n=1 Tax=Drosophila sechellia TaxID=7238 RepID=B4INY9_DROSE|nr:GM16247 [Drosophila sechellia]